MEKGLGLCGVHEVWGLAEVLGRGLWFPPPRGQSVRSQQPVSSTSLVTTSSTSHRP